MNKCAVYRNEDHDMKLPSSIIPRIFLSCVLLWSASVAHADSTGKLQFMFTAYVDVPALFPKTLASCVQYDPSTGPELQRLYDQWYEKHGRYQAELQQLLQARLSAEMGAAEAQKFIADIKPRIEQQIVSLHFPQNHKWTDNWFCTKLLPKDLKGEDLMLNFGDYVKEWKKAEASQ